MRNMIKAIFIMITLSFWLAAAGCDMHHEDSDGHEGHGHGAQEEHEQHGEGNAHEPRGDDHEGAGHEEEGHGTEDAHDEGHEDERFVELTDGQRNSIGVKIGNAGPGNVGGELTLTGEVRLNGDRVAHVVPKVSGVVTEVSASLGSVVGVGQVLAVMQSVDLAEAKSGYIDLYLQRELALKAYERKKVLYEEKIASQADLIEKEAQYLRAKAALITAGRRLSVLGMSDGEVASLPGATDADFGAYKLLAPINGTVTARHITMGEHIGDDAEVFTVADTSTVWVDLKVPSRDIMVLRPGMELVIESAYGASVKAKVSIIGPVIEEDTRSALARIVMSNLDGRWVPGTFVTARVETGAGQLPIVVPLEAVQSMEGEDLVFVPDGHGFRAVHVVSGIRGRDSVEIVSGLEPGMPYVKHGAFELKSIIATRGLGSHAGHGH